MATRWAAAHLRLRSEVRTKRAGFVLLVAVIAITSAVTMAAVAGARRSNSAYGRFRAWAHDSDIGVSGCECEPGDEDAAERLRAAFTGSDGHPSCSTAREPGSPSSPPSCPMEPWRASSRSSR